jgi:hypothetical protein
MMIWVKTEPISQLLMWISKLKLSKYVKYFWSGPELNYHKAAPVYTKKALRVERSIAPPFIKSALD